jgi:hypothetical protein
MVLFIVGLWGFSRQQIAISTSEYSLWFNYCSIVSPSNWYTINRAVLTLHWSFRLGMPTTRQKLSLILSEPTGDSGQDRPEAVFNPHMSVWQKCMSSPVASSPLDITLIGTNHDIRPSLSRTKRRAALKSIPWFPSLHVWLAQINKSIDSWTLKGLLRLSNLRASFYTRWNWDQRSQVAWLRSYHV